MNQVHISRLILFSFFVRFISFSFCFALLFVLVRSLYHVTFCPRQCHFLLLFLSPRLVHRTLLMFLRRFLGFAPRRSRPVHRAEEIHFLCIYLLLLLRVTHSTPSSFLSVHFSSCRANSCMNHEIAVRHSPCLRHDRVPSPPRYYTQIEMHRERNH